MKVYKVRTPSRTRSRGGSRDYDLSEDMLAGEILTFLASDATRLAAFLNETGLDPQSLRGALADRSLHGGLLDHLMSDESLLVAFAAATDRSPESVAAAIGRARHPSGNDM